MITALYIFGGWLLFCVVFVAFMYGASVRRGYRPTPTPDQIAWMKAAARVASRRHA